jgi:hypothetical protein
MADRAGVISITIDGSTEDCKALATIRPNDFMREAITGADGYHGTALKAAVPGADITITDRKGLDVAKLQNLIDTTVVIELANGKIWQLTNATVLDQVELTPEEGEISLVFAATSCEEVS